MFGGEQADALRREPTAEGLVGGDLRTGLGGTGCLRLGIGGRLRCACCGGLLVGAIALTHRDDACQERENENCTDSDESTSQSAILASLLGSTGRDLGLLAVGSSVAGGEELALDRRQRCLRCRIGRADQSTAPIEQRLVAAVLVPLCRGVAH